jgi:hypothetical protein
MSYSVVQSSFSCSFGNLRANATEHSAEYRMRCSYQTVFNSLWLSGTKVANGITQKEEDEYLGGTSPHHSLQINNTSSIS